MRVIDCSESQLTGRDVEFRTPGRVPIPGETVVLSMAGGRYYMAVRVNGPLLDHWHSGVLLGGGVSPSTNSLRSYVGSCGRTAEA